MKLCAPSHWTCVDFISDLHLQASEAATFAGWRAYLQNTCADAVFILGDLFEVWIGDDPLTQGSSFELECVEALRQAAEHMAVFIMRGNRDFLMGPQLMQACHARMLDDPTPLEFAGQTWLLSHGDALCKDDHSYQKFRSQVRSDAWQSDFLSKTYSQRQSIARGIRKTSESRKQQAEVYADVDSPAALSWMAPLGATTLIHGHTHRPGGHTLAPGVQRLVLSDWDLGALPPRAEVLRICRLGDHQAHVQRLPPAACGDRI